MFKITKTILLSLVFLLLSSCFATLSNQGRNVLIEVNSEEVKHCQNLGPVTGNDETGEPEGALNDIRNEAANLGANTIYIFNTNSDVSTMPLLNSHLILFRTQIIGVAYFCENNKRI